MRPDIRRALEAAVDDTPASGRFNKAHRSERAIRQSAMLFMKQIELFVENMEDQSITLQELYEEIAGEAWKGQSYE